MTIIVTGAAGFIGSHVCKALLKQSIDIIGIDNLNDYYEPALKHARLGLLTPYKNFTFHELDIENNQEINSRFSGLKIDAIIHLAAQAGVRYSLEKPFSYTQANVTGFLSLLELARNNDVNHMIYASSSSVYGRNSKTPFHEDDQTVLPASLYGATKQANELMASSYAHLYQIPLTGLRFFTVYGPWGRPDMAYWMFTKNIMKEKPINIFNHGDMARDFTYIDDIVTGILAVLDTPPNTSTHWHRIFNLGNDHPEKLMTMIETLEKGLGKTAIKNMMDMQKGDVTKTWADISKAKNTFGYQPKIGLKEGLERFIEWHNQHSQFFV